MPRPKGSKNRKSIVNLETIENVDEQIAAVESAIAGLNEELKAKKAELKALIKAKAEAERLAVEKKAEADRAKLLSAVAESGKSIDEIIEMINH